MSEHSPEPWGSSDKYNCRDRDGRIVASISGETDAQQAANKALFLAAPKMKRELEATLGWLTRMPDARLQVGTDGLERHHAILAILATTEPAEPKPPTLLDACRVLVREAGDCEPVMRGGTLPAWLAAHLPKLRTAIAAEEARERYAPEAPE